MRKSAAVTVVVTGFVLVIGLSAPANAAPTTATGVAPRTSTASSASSSTPKLPSPVRYSSSKLASSPRVTVSGILQTVDATGTMDPVTKRAIPTPDDTTYLVTDDGKSIPLADGLPANASSGSTFVGTLAITATANATLGVDADVLATASAKPLTATSTAGTDVLDSADRTQTPLAVAAAVITPAAPSTTHPAATAHKLYIAVIGAKGSSVKQTSYSTTKVKALIKKVSAYWHTQSGGVVASVKAVKIVRYTSKYGCGSGLTSTHRWWTEAGKKFSSSPNSYFGQTTGRHLVVLTVDGTSTQGPCAAKLGYVGLGTIGINAASGGFINALVGSSVGAATLAHEFGHNMSLGHANVHFCLSPTVTEGATSSSTSLDANNCGTDEYYDLYDVMGISWPGQARIPSLSLPSKDRLGFVTAADLPVAALASGSTTGTWTETLKPISGTTGVRGIHVTDPVSKVTYWVEFRSGSGQDSSLVANKRGTLCALTCATGSGYAYSFGTGVRVLREDFSNPNSPETLAVTTAPLSGSTKVRELALGTREGFSSYSGGVHVAVNWVTPTAASVTVTLTSTATLAPGAHGPELVGTTAVGKILSVVRPNFEQLSATVGYQWLRNGGAISGATASTYTLTTDDQGQPVSVAVTASKTGFTSSTVTLPAGTIGAADSHGQATSSALPAVIVPDPTVAGSTSLPWVILDTDADASSGRTYQLATSSPSAFVYSKALTADSRGILATQLPWHFGVGTQSVYFVRNDSVSTAASSVSVGQRAPSTVVTLSASKTKTVKSVVATAHVGTSYEPAPAGTVQFYSSTKLLGSVAMVTADNGVVSLRLPKFTSTGSKKITARYLGDPNYLAAKSATKVVTVTK